jgi:pantoate--beta-alanine ligase
MNVVRTVPQLRLKRKALSASVGFVPTMGGLHDGHLSLVRRAKADNPSVVVSVFVNPTQFGPSEDFAHYPRDLDRDLSLLRAEGVDLTFAPSIGELYPDGYDTWVEVRGISDRLEGASRPEHFRGVATVVAKLFNIVRPDRAYFGQKDAQQALVIKQLISDLNFGAELVVCPTARDEAGLALSSRNAYLSSEERKAASVLYRSLCLAEQEWAEGERKAQRLRDAILELLQAEPKAQLDYVSVADVETLNELETVDRPALVSLAVRIGRTRLIDNTTLPPGRRLA